MSNHRSSNQTANGHDTVSTPHEVVHSGPEHVEEVRAKQRELKKGRAQDGGLEPGVQGTVGTDEPVFSPDSSDPS